MMVCDFEKWKEHRFLDNMLLKLATNLELQKLQEWFDSYKLHHDALETLKSQGKFDATSYKVLELILNTLDLDAVKLSGILIKRMGLKEKMTTEEVDFMESLRDLVEYDKQSVVKGFKIDPEYYSVIVSLTDRGFLSLGEDYNFVLAKKGLDYFDIEQKESIWSFVKTLESGRYKDLNLYQDQYGNKKEMLVGHDGDDDFEYVSTGERYA